MNFNMFVQGYAKENKCKSCQNNKINYETKFKDEKIKWDGILYRRKNNFAHFFY